jgi:hypothetical protein
MGCTLSTTASAVFVAAGLILVVCSTPVIAQECSPADIELRNQAEVDAFHADHGPCDRAANLLIQGADILDLDGLSSLVAVSGRLNVLSNPQLVSIDGLPALETVGELLVMNNQSLVAIDGLNALTATGS